MSRPDRGAGYGKPPFATQFKKGQSGNPKGRPKLAAAPVADRSAATLTLREAERVISVREGDGVRQMTQIEAILRSQYVAASKGSAYAQKHIIERYDRAEREKRLEREATDERWRKYVHDYRKLLVAAEKNGTEPPDTLPHPDDVEIDPVRGVIFHGPYDEESLQRTYETCALRDVLLIQDAFDRREATIEIEGPTTALYCALELNQSLAARFQLPDFDICMVMSKLDVTPKRELRRSLRTAWATFGRDFPPRSFLPPLRQFLEQLQAIWEAYRELRKAEG